MYEYSRQIEEEKMGERGGLSKKPADNADEADEANAKSAQLQI